MAMSAPVFVIKIMALEILARARVKAEARPAAIKLGIIPTSVTVASGTNKIPGTC